MAFAAPRLDHVVVDVRGEMDQAVSVYRSLGFQLTERGRHSLGSINHLAVFDDNYLELLGFNEKAEEVRADISGFPIGLNGLVFKTDRSDALFQEFESRNVPVEEPLAFSRPVIVPETEKVSDAKFRVVRLSAGTLPFGRVYFCQHFTPDLVWRPKWRHHPNGATNINRVTVAVRDRDASEEILVRMFGSKAVRATIEGSLKLEANRVQIELASPTELARRFGDAMPDPAGRNDYMVALGFSTSSLSETARTLSAGGIKQARIEPERILIPAREAMNVALEFIP